MSVFVQVVIVVCYQFGLRKFKMTRRKIEKIRKAVKYESDLKMLEQLDNQILGISNNDPDRVLYYIFIVCILGLIASVFLYF